MSADCVNANADYPREGRYANYFQVGYNAFEFLLDFGQLYSESERAHIHTRIIISPAYIKSFLQTLWESIERQAEIEEQIVSNWEGRSDRDEDERHV